MEKAKLHWNKVYESKEIEQQGWYEKDPNPSFELIKQLDLSKDDKIIDVGCGASTLIDALVNAGYSNIIGVDISSTALQILENRIGDSVKLIEDNITQPDKINEIDKVQLWHDRAVLHFIHDQDDKETYVKTLDRIVDDGGYVIIATFSLDGVEKCSGLPVNRYSSELISELLGDNYTLIKEIDYLYHTPSGGERPYIYTVFEKEEN